MKLSNTMLETIEVMKRHNGKLIRYRGGWWSWEYSDVKYYMRKDNRQSPNFSNERLFDDDYTVPIWDCDVKTLRALHNRGLVILNEESKECLLKENNYEE